MIIARLVHDIPALKACAATCLSWYNIAFPHIHHTLVFRDRSQTTSRRYLNPLVPTHKLGLLPFVKKAQFNRGRYATHWIVPAIFDSRSMRYFRALVNLQDLAIESLDFSLFPQGVGAFFGHFSPTLRSLALTNPLGSRRQLVDFFRLFPGLDDLVVCGYYGKGEGHEPLDDELMAIRGGLRGRLHLKTFHDEGLLKDIIVAFGGIRFTFMRLESVSGVPLLLKACADTLQTVHIYPGDRFLSGKTIPFPCARSWRPNRRCFPSSSSTLQLFAQRSPSIFRDSIVFTLPSLRRLRLRDTGVVHDHISSLLRGCHCLLCDRLLGKTAGQIISQDVQN